MNRSVAVFAAYLGLVMVPAIEVDGAIHLAESEALSARSLLLRWMEALDSSAGTPLLAQCMTAPAVVADKRGHEDEWIF